MRGISFFFGFHQDNYSFGIDHEGGHIALDLHAEKPQEFGFFESMGLFHFRVFRLDFVAVALAVPECPRLLEVNRFLVDGGF